MAEILSQNEIDDLLNSNLLDGSESGGDNDEMPSGGGDADLTGKSKIYKFAKDINPRFNFPYKSPIIKRGKFLFNPSPDDNVPNDESTVVVQSLSNYAVSMKKRESMH